MKDILKELDSLTDSNKEIEKVETPREEPSLGSVDYTTLKKIAAKTKLYAVKNVSDTDLICDWDLPLMPEDLKPDFDKYLSERYNQFKLNETSSSVRLVVVMVAGGRTINFLHDFMTDRRIPILESVIEGPSTVIKSQFVIPAGITVLCTEEQISSIKRYEKTRRVNGDKMSDWSGVLVIKEIGIDKLPRVKYSMVTSSDIKSNNFELKNKFVQTRKSSGNLELSDELDDLLN